MNYATQVGKPTAHITKKKSRLKVYNGHVVFLNDKDNFEFEIHNPTNKTVLCKIKLNGSYISTGGIVLKPGQRVFLDVAAGTTMRDGVYEVANVTTNTFTVTSATSGTASGTVTMYTNIYFEADTYNTIGLPVYVPGEGIYCPNGIFVGVGSSVTATVIYG